ncbi:unnamed protein product [Rotaria magnacalcarata]|uniref:WAP domain-containing protein n=1 Tax=Rotaria magnacalcarata TaxID=392030 RepID=A0A8S2MPT8_9BILA|nr:unnamed protein product [Rotaria magnacalcarata]
MQFVHISLTVFLLDFLTVREQIADAWSSCLKLLCDRSIIDNQACYRAKTSNGSYVGVPTMDCDDFDTCDKDNKCSTPRLLCIVDSCCKKSICVPRVWAATCKTKAPADRDDW